MKIAQVSPLYESVPPKLYGGTERVVSTLTEELLFQGHDVTLFASGDSLTKARLIAPCDKALRLDPDCIDPCVYHTLLMELVRQAQEDFDIIHYHIDYIHFPLSRTISVPNLTTLHGRLNIPELNALYKEFNDLPVVSISYAQRLALPEANWVGTVYHGLKNDRSNLNLEKGNYLAFLGRISPEKRVDRAIEIAIRCQIPLKIAAKIDKVDREYFESEIKHLLDHPLIEYIGEIGDAEKPAFLGNAMVLFPIDWPEPFGLVMIEAMACGTPVVAFPNGSVPEVIDEGMTGFMVNSIDEAVDAVSNKLPNLNRNICRTVFEKRFSAEKMAKDYINIYENLLSYKNKRRFNILKMS
jgi:glycosyltransferase involved in cell wall biosynthesis